MYIHTYKICFFPGPEICIDVFIGLCMHISVYVCIYVCIYVCAYIDEMRLFRETNTWMDAFCQLVYVHISIYIYTYIPVHVCIHTIEHTLSPYLATV